MDENLRAILNREKLEHILDLFLEQGFGFHFTRFY